MVVNLETKGNEGASLMFETRPENGWVVQALAEANPYAVGNSLSLAVYRSMPNDTDYSPFRDAGVQGLNFSSIGGANLYHQAFDDLDHISLPTIQHQGEYALSLARYNPPRRLQLVLIDPKRRGFGLLSPLPHLLNHLVGNKFTPGKSEIIIGGKIYKVILTGQAS